MLVRSEPKLRNKRSFLTNLPEGLIGAAVGVCILNALCFIILAARNNRLHGADRGLSYGPK